MPEPDSDKIPYSEWRPIGVCDNGPPSNRKAQMFSKSDFAKVTAPHVTRDNWQQLPEVQRILKKYEHKLIQISDIAQAMARPQVERVELVGTVLNFGKTPGLNKESTEGKVQLFQLHFRDRGEPEKKRPWWAVVAALCCVGLGVGVMVLLWNALNQPWGTAPATASSIRTCADLESPRARIRALRNVRAPVLEELKSLPRWSDLKSAGDLCASGNGQLREEEVRTVRCAVAASPHLSGKAAQALQRCAEALCAAGGPGLQPFCNSL
jgi:hypothetical protein